jgi:hypothetical protein
MRTFSMSTDVCGTAGSAATATVAANAQTKVETIRRIFGVFTTVSPFDLCANWLQLAGHRMTGAQKPPEGLAAYPMRSGGRTNSQRELGAPESKTAPEGPFASIRW